MDVNNKRSLFWPILLIGVGIISLLVTFNVLPSISLRALIRLWPLILIIIGLQLIFGRRSPAVSGWIDRRQPGAVGTFHSFSRTNA